MTSISIPLCLRSFEIWMCVKDGQRYAQWCATVNEPLNPLYVLKDDSQSQLNSHLPSIQQDRKCLINGQFYGPTCGKEVVSAFFSGHLLNNNELLYPWMMLKTWKHPLLMSSLKHLGLSCISVLILDYLVKANTQQSSNNYGFWELLSNHIFACCVIMLMMDVLGLSHVFPNSLGFPIKIGRASCRERV